MKFWSNSEVPDADGKIPEKKLLAAVLQRAVTDFLTTTGDIKLMSRHWLYEEDQPENTPLKFRFICEALDLDVDRFRKAISLQEELYNAENAQEEVLKIA